MISTVDRDAARGQDNMAATNKAHVREWNQAEFHSYMERTDSVLSRRSSYLPSVSDFPLR